MSDNQCETNNASAENEDVSAEYREYWRMLGKIRVGMPVFDLEKTSSLDDPSDEILAQAGFGESPTSDYDRIAHVLHLPDTTDGIPQFLIITPQGHSAVLTCNGDEFMRLVSLGSLVMELKNSFSSPNGGSGDQKREEMSLVDFISTRHPDLFGKGRSTVERLDTPGKRERRKEIYKSAVAESQRRFLEQKAAIEENKLDLVDMIRKLFQDQDPSE